MVEGPAHRLGVLNALLKCDSGSVGVPVGERQRRLRAAEAGEHRAPLPVAGEMGRFLNVASRLGQLADRDQSLLIKLPPSQQARVENAIPVAQFVQWRPSRADPGSVLAGKGQVSGGIGGVAEAAWLLWIIHILRAQGAAVALVGVATSHLVKEVQELVRFC